jgi:hypothetical protein
VGERYLPQQSDDSIYSKNQKTRILLWAKGKNTTNEWLFCPTSTASHPMPSNRPSLATISRDISACCQSSLLASVASFFWNFSLERLSRPYKKNVYTIRTNITVPQKQNSRNKNEVQVQYNMKQEQKCIEIQSTVSWGSSQQAYTNHKLSF